MTTGVINFHGLNKDWVYNDSGPCCGYCIVLSLQPFVNKRTYFTFKNKLIINSNNY